MSAFTKITDYFRSAKSEMFKVSWPSREQTIRYSSLVIGLSLVVAAFFSALDYGFTLLTDAGLSARARISAAQQTTQTQQPTQPDVTVSTATPATNLDLQNAQPIAPATDNTKK